MFGTTGALNSRQFGKSGAAAVPPNPRYLAPMFPKFLGIWGNGGCSGFHKSLGILEGPVEEKGNCE